MYIMQVAEKSRCPKCNALVMLLSPEEFFPKAPWFYICFPCKFVAQLGVGEVREEPEYGSTAKTGTV